MLCTKDFAIMNTHATFVSLCGVLGVPKTSRGREGEGDGAEVTGRSSITNNTKSGASKLILLLCNRV